MGYALYSGEEKRLQRKLIPVNILIFLISIVAAVSLLVTPLFKVNAGKFFEEIVKLTDTVALTEGETDGDSEDDASVKIKLIAEMLDAELVFEPIVMAKVLFAPAEEKTSILASTFLLDNGLFEKAAISMINMSIVASSPDAGENALGKINLSELNAALDKFNGVKNKAEFDSKIDGFINVLQGQVEVDLSAEDRSSITDFLNQMYDKTVENTTGEFTAEKMICVNLSPKDGEVYTSYEELLEGVASADPETAGEINATLANITAMISQMSSYYGYMFIFVLFCALVWLILGLFAFFRMFKRNKRFTMWYAKLWGGLPCFIFGVVLSFGCGLILPQIAATAQYAGMFAAFSTLTWISGVCYLLMWLVSVCWAFPIKHRIRKIRKGGF